MISAERKRRIVRTTRLVVAMVVLLPILYVTSWLILSRAVNHGIVNAGFGQAVRPVFRPLILYCDLRQPGADTLTRLWWTVTAIHEDGERQRGWFLGPQYPMPGVDQ